jgi:pyridoxine 5-phosphate synthase
MAQIQLSVNINKYALLRNSRGRNLPNLMRVADSCIAAGCRGITVHPRADERHIRWADVPKLAAHLANKHPAIELNIECEDLPAILDIVHSIRPAQCTLVPVTPGEVTSDHGWVLPQQHNRLRKVIAPLKAAGIRVSLFADCNPAAIPAFSDTGADRVELYTGPYAWAWGTADASAALRDLTDSVHAARRAGMGVNAGHDLDRFNLADIRDLPINEVSIGHAQICRALEVGTTQSIGELLAALATPR